MKLTRRAKTDEEMLRDFPRRARAKDWFMKVEEFAAGGYHVHGRDRWGREIMHTGSDVELDDMIERVERYGEQLASGANSN